MVGKAVFAMDRLVVDRVLGWWKINARMAVTGMAGRLCWGWSCFGPCSWGGRCLTIGLRLLSGSGPLGG